MRNALNASEDDDLVQVAGLAKTANGTNTAVSLRLVYDLPRGADDPVAKMTTLAGAKILKKVALTGKDKQKAMMKLEKILDMDWKTEVGKIAGVNAGLLDLATKLGQISNVTAAKTNLVNSAWRYWRKAMASNPSMADSVVDTSSLIASVQNSLPAAENKEQVGTLLSALCALYQDDNTTCAASVLAISPPLHTHATVLKLNNVFKPGIHDNATHPDAIALAETIQQELTNNYQLAGGQDVKVHVSLPFSPGSIEANASTSFSSDTVDPSQVEQDAANITQNNGVNGTSVSVTKFSKLRLPIAMRTELREGFVASDELKSGDVPRVRCDGKSPNWLERCTRQRYNDDTVTHINNTCNDSKHPHNCRTRINRRQRDNYQLQHHPDSNHTESRQRRCNISKHQHYSNNSRNVVQHLALLATLNHLAALEALKQAQTIQRHNPILMQTVRALAGSTQKVLYQNIVCLANRPGSVSSDFNLVFNQSANLQTIQDTLDNNTRRLDGTYLFGDLQSDLPPSGRASAVPVQIAKMSSDRGSRLFWQVTVPSMAGMAGPADPDHAVLHCKRKGMLLQGLQRQVARTDLASRTALDLASWTTLDLASWTTLDSFYPLFRDFDGDRRGRGGRKKPISDSETASTNKASFYNRPTLMHVEEGDASREAAKSGAPTRCSEPARDGGSVPPDFRIRVWASGTRGEEFSSFRCLHLIVVLAKKHLVKV
ncbi:unnamed protein product [Darwinula stevensoni]|uniref:Uncharacterized protein n=1 Tax=Darwinula stevensoni TaxID=69355 RepID=A0A7R9AGS5_9CRUS|nr:unnamed protein product [Darwinula stevensoni]CAG0904630.1 unnamed protein product [Darwinula stevensoni]